MNPQSSNDIDLSSQSAKSAKAESKWRKFFDVSGLLITIVGFVFVAVELNYVGQQNRFLRESVDNSYRPAGVIEYQDNWSQGVVLSYQDSTGSTFLTRVREANLRNLGAGLLNFIGAFGETRDTAYNLLDELLAGNIEKIKWDPSINGLRIRTIMPGEKGKFLVSFDRIPTEHPAYINTLVFYMDQADNLFATERSEIMMYQRNDDIRNEGVHFKTQYVPMLYDSAEVIRNVCKTDQVRISSVLQRMNDPAASYFRTNGE